MSAERIKKSLCVVSCVVALVVALFPAGAGASQSKPDPGATTYVKPVDGVVIDGFRPPPSPYSEGNRGLEYLTAPGTPVVAAGDGEVIFAGQVAGSLHVTVVHPDGLRTSYSFLSSLVVTVGQQVRRGDPLGAAGMVVHFGVRSPDGTYLDPAALLARVLPKVVVRLVPGLEEGLEALVEIERRSFWELVIEEGARLASGAIERGTEVMALVNHYVTELQVDTHLTRMMHEMGEWVLSRLDCTASDVSPPEPQSRRIVIEVAGVGSTSEEAAIARLDTETLGYADGDVMRFSYAGGRVPSSTSDTDADTFSAVPTSTYTPADTQIDIRESARRLALLLEEVARIAPGVPIDVIAHSQGGVVTRIAVDQLAATGELPSEVQNVITLASPHQGSDVATAVAAARTGETGRVVIDGIRSATGLNLDPDSESIGQLSETSELNAEMADVRLPQSVRFTSIAGRGDLVVPSPRTEAPGARNVVVPLVGPKAHDAIPSAPATTREVALTLAGMPPTCVGMPTAIADVVSGEMISTVEDTVGMAALAANVVGTPLTRWGPFG